MDDKCPPQSTFWLDESQVEWRKSMRIFAMEIFLEWFHTIAESSVGTNYAKG